MADASEPDERLWRAGAQRHERAVDSLLAGALDDAEAFVVAALAELLRGVGDDHPDYANALNTLARVRERRGQLADAVGIGRRALAILDAYRGEPLVAPLRACALASLAYCLALRGEFAEAEARSREALALTPARAEAWVNLGVSLRLAGRHDEAEDAYEQARALHERAGERVPAALDHNLAGLAFARGEYRLAEAHARRALATREQTGEGGSFDFGMDLCGLGDALAGLGRLREAEDAYRRGLDCYERAPGRAEHVEVAFALHNLGDVLAEVGRASEAESCYRRALSLKLRALGPDSHELAATSINLALLRAGLGCGVEARDLAARALELVARLPAEHPVRAGVEACAPTLLGRRPGDPGGPAEPKDEAPVDDRRAAPRVPSTPARPRSLVS